MFSWLFSGFGGNDRGAFEDRPTPSAIPATHTFAPRNPRQGTATPSQTPSKTPEVTFRAVTTSPVRATRADLRRIAQDGTPRVRQQAESILPRMCGEGRTPEFEKD